MRFRISPRGLAVAMAIITLARASTAMSSCPRNGGTVCTAPGNQNHLAGAGWTEPAQLCPSCPDAGGRGSALFVWEDSRDFASSGVDLYWYHHNAPCFDSTARLGAPLAIGPGDQTHPAATPSGAFGRVGQCFPGPCYDSFGVIIAWEDAQGADRDVYARRLLGYTVQPATWDTTAIVICGANGDQTLPVIVSSGRGGAIVGWLDSRAGTTAVYAQGLDSAGVTQWTSDGNQVCGATGERADLHAISDEAGGAIFCWVDRRSNEAIYAARLLPSGTLAMGWNADGNVVAAGVHVSGPIRIATDGIRGPDGGGGLIVAWTETGSDPDGDVRVQRLDSAGASVAGWPADGLPVAIGPGAQRAADLNGGYIVWEQDTTPTNTDLYAARLAILDAAIAPGWPVAVCHDPASQFHARAIASDGGVIFGWTDGRSADGTTDLYVVRLNQDGTPTFGWTPNGTRLTGAINVQDFLLPLPSVNGGAQFGWIDHRDEATNGADVYGSKVTMGGGVDVAASMPRGAALGAPRPNPARARVVCAIDAPSTGQADVFVVDVAGRRIRSLLEDALAAGHREVTWDGLDDGGRAVRPGLYFVRARIGERLLARSVVLLP